MAETVKRSLFLPREIAAMYRISINKVLAWVRSGELKAINVGRDNAKRPRFLIPVESLSAFEASRASRPPATKAKRRRRQPADVKSFY